MSCENVFPFYLICKYDMLNKSFFLFSHQINDSLKYLTIYSLVEMSFYPSVYASYDLKFKGNEYTSIRNVHISPCVNKYSAVYRVTRASLTTQQPYIAGSNPCIIFSRETTKSCRKQVLNFGI